MPCMPCYKYDLERLRITLHSLSTHPGAMDTFARGLRCASKLLDDGVLPALVQERYSSFDSGIGAKIEKGTTNFEELEVQTNSGAC